MNFKNLKIKNLLLVVGICVAYPAVRAFTLPQGQRLLFFMNAITVIGLILIILGIITMAIQKGDFDITTYIGQRAVDKNIKPFAAYVKDRDEERKGKFNYPLFTAILFLATAAVLALLYR